MVILKKSFQTRSVNATSFILKTFFPASLCWPGSRARPFQRKLADWKVWVHTSGNFSNLWTSLWSFSFTNDYLMTTLRYHHGYSFCQTQRPHVRMRNSSQRGIAPCLIINGMGACQRGMGRRIYIWGHINVLCANNVWQYPFPTQWNNIEKHKHSYR